MQEKEPYFTNPNVYILDKAFYMPQLRRYRRIWLYLPPEYREGQKQYPVLYMHDGKNLFEEATAFGEEWGVDETLDRMRNKCIVVGIDNGGEWRGNEYTIHNTEQFGKGEGLQYLQFIVHTLKPYIDKTYRTPGGRETTFMAGSSLGGLISLYGGLMFPGVFGALGIFSPALWIDSHLIKEISSHAEANRKTGQRYYFFAGEQEGDLMVPQVDAVTAILKCHKQYEVEKVIDLEGTHSEATWRWHYPEFYKWLMKGIERKAR